MEFAAAGPRVLLADDHHFFREGLREILVSGGMVVVGEAHDGARAIKLTHELNPDIVVIDLKMPHTSGIDALQQIAAASPDARLVVLSVSADEADVLEALAAGACCYLLKDTTADGLIRSILLAADGHAVLSRDVVRALATRAQADSEALRRTSANGISLTAREREVIKLLAKGSDNATIGRELSISRHTVKQYVTNIFEKVGVQSRVQAAVFAVRNGLA